MPTDTEILDRLARVAADNDRQDTEINAMRTGMGILHADLNELKVASQVQADALKTLAANSEKMSATFDAFQKTDESKARFYKVLSGLVTVFSIIIATYIANKLGVDPAVIKEVLPVIGG